MVDMNSLISPEVQKMWNDWELRINTILSMSLQIFLMVFVTRRKTTKNKWSISAISMAHSLADWTAAYGVGLISSSQGSNSFREAIPSQLLAFWAPFFLLHLGGADTITSPSLDDDYLLLKQLVGLISHVLAIVLIFLKSFPDKLLLPTLLVFVAGIFRNARRVSALLRRSHEKLKDSRGTISNAGSDHMKFAETCSEMSKANLKIESLHPPSASPKAKRELSAQLLRMPKDAEQNSLWILEDGIFLYDIFKCFIPKVSFSSKHRLVSREFFCNRTPTEAFKLIELELYCLYKLLYTQSLDLQSMLGGHAFPSFNVILVFASFVLFGLSGKHEWHKFDIVLTYLLLSAALAQEFISYCRSILSPRTFTKGFLHYLRILKDSFHGVIPHFLNMKLFSCAVNCYVFKRQRWSESVCQVNSLAWCLPYHCQLAVLADNVAALFGVNDVLDILRLNLMVSVHPVTEHVKEVIFHELKTKSAVAEKKETAIKICSQRGDWAILRSGLYNQLRWSLGKLEYGESLILWHIATDITYYYDEEIEGNDDETEKRSQFCRILSDYMFYLLVLQPTTMVSVAGNCETVFHDTCAHARSFFLRRSTRSRSEAREQLLSEYGHMDQRRPIGGDRRRSVLIDASVLAQQLQDDLGRNKWKLMSQVWVELLAYAAFHCEADIHAQQPSQGGELLTFVWLLINHFGFGKQLMEEDAQTDDTQSESHKSHSKSN